MDTFCSTVGIEPPTARDPSDTGHVYLCIDLKSFYASVEHADVALLVFGQDVERDLREKEVGADACRGADARLGTDGVH